MKRLIFSLVLFCSSAYGQELVKDINTTPASQPFSDRNICLQCGGKLFFIAQDGDNGRELWTTDGTEAGTRMVVDAEPGPGNGIENPVLQCHGGKVFFYGASIWSSDGTEAGTTAVFPYRASYYMIVGDKLILSDNNNVIYTGNSDGTNMHQLTQLAPYVSGGSVIIWSLTSTGNVGYIIAFYYDETGAFLNSDLMSTDGTSITTLKSDMGYSIVTYNSVFGDKLFFEVYDYYGASNDQVWVTDGTVENTKLISDLGLQIPYDAGDLASVNGKFVLNRFGETWITDGTAEGTVKIMDDIAARSAIAFDNRIYFSGMDPSTYATIIVSTDLNFENESQIPQNPDNQNRLLGIVGDKLLMSLNMQIGDAGAELWSVAADGLSIVKDIALNSTGSNSRSFANLSDDLGIFIAQDQDHGYEYWKTDGTGEGTTLLKDIADGTTTSGADNVYFYNDRMYFGAYVDLYNKKLWKSDGTEEGTTLVDASKSYFGMFLGTGKYIISDGIDKTDVTTGSRTLLHSTQGESGSASGPVYAKGITIGNNLLYYWRYDSWTGENLYGTEIYRANPVTNEFGLLKDINPGQASSGLGGNLTGAYLNDKLIFSAQSEDGFEPWITDGTTGGTSQIKDLVDGDSYPQGFVTIGNKVFFQARGTDLSFQLYITDGTEAGTKFVKEPGEKGGVTSNHIGALGSKAIYGWTDGVSGFSELWSTDGTAEGTQKIVGLGDVFTTWNYTTLGDKVLFFADNSTLWATDGTAAGTHTIDFTHGSNINIRSIVVRDGFMYFYEGVSKKIWRTDGAGAQLVGIADLGYEREFYVTDKYVLFFMDNPKYGTELYRYVLENITGVEEENEKLPESIVVYPNPTTHTLYVKATGPSSLRIVDLSGRERHNQFINNDVSIDVSSYADGMYVVILNNKQFKFIKSQR